MLRAVLIDDERPALDEMAYLLKENSVDVAGAFQNTDGVLDFILREKPDVVFIDIELRGVSGIDFGVKLQNAVDNISIVFVTAYPEYALNAFRAYPLDYLVKPVDEQRLIKTLLHIKQVAVQQKSGDRKFTIRCFGKFEIAYGNYIIKLPTKKARELLAYLLCNEESTVYRDELTQIIFGSGDDAKMQTICG